MNKTQFKVGDELLGTDGLTRRLCPTAKGKEQWRVVGPDGTVIKRGRKEGTSVLTNVTLAQLLTHLGGTKFAKAMQKTAKEAGIDAPFAVEIPVSSKLGIEAAPKVEPKAKAKVGTVETV